ncbi:MAG: NAD(P)/FAD-dependent oxidoreductase, partial [Candidatus Hodarchaeales archaeon]
SSNIRGTAREYYEKFLKANKDLAEKVEKPLNYFAGEGPIFDIDKYVNKNIVFVGDAAGLTDPFFGYGMNSAIVSGYYAGNFIKNALKEDLALLQKYDKTIKEKFDKRLAYLYQRVFESLKNDDLDLIAEILNELDKKTDMDMILRQLSGRVI